jgi:hypothetical protein
MSMEIRMYVVLKDDKLRDAKEVHRICLKHGESPPEWVARLVESNGVRARSGGLVEISLYSSECRTEANCGCTQEINLESLQKLWPGAVGIVARIE